MKTYIATYYRHNPQLSSGGYQTTRKIEAVSITSARKKAREITEGCVYGSQYSAAALYDGGWRSVDIPEMIALYKLSDEEAEQIANDLRKIEQGNEED